MVMGVLRGSDGDVRFEISGGYVCVAADTFRAAHKLGHQNLRCARTVNHLSPRLGRESACTERLYAVLTC